MNARIRDLTNQQFGNWRVMGLSHTTGTKTFWRCRCVCGKIKNVVSYHLCMGASKGCFDCLQDKMRSSHPSTTHGMSSSAEYNVWTLMWRRCTNKKLASYRHYGGRGITVCDRWRKFENFFADMGRRPIGRTIDRKNNNDGYSPENCVWSTWREQQNNRRSNRWITIGGVKRTMSQWARIKGLNVGTVFSRLKRGCCPEDAIKLT